jgi:hypothetical protein
VNPLFAAAADVQAFCQRQGWQSAIIGGVAVQRWGEPRLTRDVDLTVLTGLGGEGEFVDMLLQNYRARLDGAREFALQHRVVLVETANGVPLDISLAGLPFEARLMARSSAFSIDGSTALITCSAEDLIVLKVFAGRMQDWLDVEGITHDRLQKAGGLSTHTHRGCSGRMRTIGTSCQSKSPSRSGPSRSTALSTVVASVRSLSTSTP